MFKVAQWQQDDVVVGVLHHLAGVFLYGDCICVRAWVPSCYSGFLPQFRFVCEFLCVCLETVNDNLCSVYPASCPMSARMGTGNPELDEKWMAGQTLKVCEIRFDADVSHDTYCVMCHLQIRKLYTCTKTNNYIFRIRVFHPLHMGTYKAMQWNAFVNVSRVSSYAFVSCLYPSGFQVSFFLAWVLLQLHQPLTNHSNCPTECCAFSWTVFYVYWTSTVDVCRTSVYRLFII